MAYLVRTLILFFIGVWLKWRFKDDLNFKTIKIIMMQVFLPAVIFYLILTNKTEIAELNFWNVIIATLGLNVLTFIFARFILPGLLPGLGRKIINTNAVMLSAYAPCVTVVPIAAAISTNANATYAALFDIGDKFFIFIVLFAYISIQVQEKNKNLISSAWFFFRKIILQPINLALITSLLLSSQGIQFDDLNPVLQQVIIDIKNPLLILIPIFIAGVVKFENFSTKLLSVLMCKYGFGLLVSSAFLYAFPNIISADLGLLVITAPLASSSLWAKQNLMEFSQERINHKFDLQFADDLFTNSFGISLILNFTIFSVGDSFVNPYWLLVGGISLITLSMLCYRIKMIVHPKQTV